MRNGAVRPDNAALDRRACLNPFPYFEENLKDRPEIKREWCERVVQNPVVTEVQADGRIRSWGFIEEFGGRALRVITLEDGETLFNAFFDRGFVRRYQRGDFE